MKEISVKLPNGEIQPMKYPDGWSDDQVKQSIYKHFPQYLNEGQQGEKNIQKAEDSPFQSKETTGLSGIAKDAAGLPKKFMNSLGDALKFIKDVPQMTEDLGGDILDHPFTGQVRAAAQTGARAAEIGKGVVNAPHDALSYLGKKKVIPKALKKYNELPFTHIPEDTGLERTLGLDKRRKGDRLSRALADVGMLAEGSVAVAKGGRAAYRSANQSALKEGDAALGEQISHLKEKYDLTKDDTALLREKLEEQHAAQFPGSPGKTTPSGQRIQQYRKKRQVEAIKPLATDITDVDESWTGMKPEAVEPKAKSDVDAAHAHLEKSLESKKAHENEGGKKGRDIVMADKDKASKLYDGARKHYDDKGVNVDNTSEIKDMKTVLEKLKAEDELAPGYGSGGAAEKSVELSLSALENETVSATDLFDLSRSLEKRSSNARHRQYATDAKLTDIERRNLGEIADKYQAQASKINKKLESTGDKSVRADLKEANRLWSDYSSLKRHPAGRELLYNQKLTPGFMKGITGIKSGSDYLQRIVESSPGMKKNILAMKFSKKSGHGELLNPDELTESYIRDLPKEDQAAIETLKNAKGNVPKAKELAESMKAHAQIKQLNSEIKAHEVHEKKLDAQFKKQKAEGKDIKQLEKQRKELQEKIQEKHSRLKAVADIIIKAKGVTGLLKLVSL